MQTLKTLLEFYLVSGDSGHVRKSGKRVLKLLFPKSLRLVERAHFQAYCEPVHGEEFL